MSGTPTTGELKVKMDNMCNSIEELKQDLRNGFSELKKDLSENYVRNETLKLSLEPLQEFKKTVTGVGIGLGMAALLGVLGFLTRQAILNFKV